jgi:hypothetical protein
MWLHMVRLAVPRVLDRYERACGVFRWAPCAVGARMSVRPAPGGDRCVGGGERDGGLVDEMDFDEVRGGMITGHLLDQL